MNLQTFGPILTSGVIASLVTAVFSKMSVDKNIRIENITKERQRWREQMRELVKEVNEAFIYRDSAKLRIIKAALVVRLNPEDSMDKAIVKSIEELPNRWDYPELDEFNQYMAALLKHDWERVKGEVSVTAFIRTFDIALVALIIATTVIFVQFNHLVSSPLVYLLVVGAVLVAYFRFIVFFYRQLGEQSKNELKEKRRSKWNPRYIPEQAHQQTRDANNSF